MLKTTRNALCSPIIGRVIELNHEKGVDIEYIDYKRRYYYDCNSY